LEFWFAGSPVEFLMFPSPPQPQEVVQHAGFDGVAQLGLDLEEAISRAEAFDALRWSLVFVVFEPEFNPHAGGGESVELGARISKSCQIVAQRRSI
jgi:hypothetical protein